MHACGSGAPATHPTRHSRSAEHALAACCTTPTRTSSARCTLASCSSMRLAPHSSPHTAVHARTRYAHGAFSSALRGTSAWLAAGHAVPSVAPVAADKHPHTSLQHNRGCASVCCTTAPPSVSPNPHTPPKSSWSISSPRRAAAARCLRSHPSLPPHVPPQEPFGFALVLPPPRLPCLPPSRPSAASPDHRPSVTSCPRPRVGRAALTRSRGRPDHARPFRSRLRPRG